MAFDGSATVTTSDWGLTTADWGTGQVFKLTQPPLSRASWTITSLAKENETAPPPASSFSRELQALIDAVDVDSFDEAVGAAQERLRKGDHELAYELDHAARDELNLSADDRAAAIVTLAGARVPTLEAITLAAIAALFTERDEIVQIAAIAAATHLFPRSKHQLRDVALRVSTEGSPRARRAATAFLKTLKNA